MSEKEDDRQDIFSPFLIAHQWLSQRISVCVFLPLLCELWFKGHSFRVGTFVLMGRLPCDTLRPFGWWLEEGAGSCQFNWVPQFW